MFTQEELEIIETVIHVELQMIYFIKGFDKKQTEYERSLKDILKKIQLLQKPKPKVVNK